MKKIAIVTGGAGFIGSHMVDFLIKKNFKVIVIDDLSGGNIKNIKQHLKRKNFLLLKKNICDNPVDIKYIKKADYIFHFAGKGDIVPSIQKPFQYFNTNVMGTINILELARRLKVKKVVYAASSSCYGLAKVPTTEKNKISTLYPYALSKYQGEQVAFHWHQVYNLPVNSIRIFNVYGTRVRTTGVYGAVFGVFFKQKLEKTPFTVVGDGKQSRDFLYVTDVAKAFLLSATTSKTGQIFNLGAGNPQSINQLVELIGGEVEYLPKRPGEPECTWADITKICSELSWKPDVTFSEGVKNMMNEIENWRDAPLWDSSSIEKATKTWFQYMDKNGEHTR